MKKPQRVVVLGVMAAALVVVAVGALLLPRFIDSQLIKDRIRDALAKESRGEVQLGAIAWAWFPRPRAVIENAQVVFEDGIQASIRSAEIYPSLLYLFAGRLVVRRAALWNPRFKIRVAASLEKAFNLEELEDQVRSTLLRFTSELRVRRVDVNDGSVEIAFGDRPSVILENVAARSVASPSELRFRLSARSNLGERLNVAGKVAPATLASQFDIGVRRLKIKESLALLSPPCSEYTQRGEASLDVNIASVGLRKVNASINGSVGPLVVARQGGAATVEAKRLKGEMTYQGGALQISAEQLELGSPRLRASGDLKIDSGLLSVRLEVRDADIAEVSDVALRVSGDSDDVRKIFSYLRAGTISDMTLQSAGRSFAEMASSKRIIVAGSMRDGKVFVPGLDLELERVNGLVRIAGGILEAEKVAAIFGSTRGWDGRLRLGLAGKAAPFHLDMSVQSGARELQSILLKLVHDETFHVELSKVRNLTGELSGRLTLGETLDALAPVVAIWEVNISANYDPIPFPIAIRGGRINYEQKMIRLENLRASVGRSRFENLTVNFHRDGSRQMQVQSHHVSLDLQETETLLRSLKEWPMQFDKLESARGQIALENLSLAGAYDDPAGWIFASTGAFNQVEIGHADFSAPLILSRGKFALVGKQIKFTDMAAVMSDGSMTVSGTLEHMNGRPIGFDASGTANVGEKMIQWLSRGVDWSNEIKLRSPLNVVSDRFAWREGGDFSFRGEVKVAGGPRFSLDTVKSPQGMVLRNLTLDDGDRRARLTFQLAKNHLDLSFNGELTSEMIDRAFVSFPVKAGSLRGDVEVSAALDDPLRISLHGELSGSKLLVPLGPNKVTVEKLGLGARGENIEIRSADLRWGKSRIVVSGNIAAANDKLHVDLDIAGDRIDWGDLEGFVNEGNKQRKEDKAGILSKPGVEGTIRLKTDHLVFERFDLISLAATTVISPSGTRAEIDQGMVCGIAVTGRADFVGKEMGIDLRLAATDAQLEPTVDCLTDRRDLKGVYSLKARLAGRDDRDLLLRSLAGNFELSSRDGEFVRAPGIDATFDYLNATGDFKVPFPDLDRETFPYRFIGIKGSIDGQTLIADEVNVASSMLNLSGQGKVDLERNRIDGKGLIAVLKPVDQVISKIPVIGSRFVTSLVGIPVRISGSLDRPDVSYLSPADVGAELVNIPLRILKLPLGAIRLFTPTGEARDNDTMK